MTTSPTTMRNSLSRSFTALAFLTLGLGACATSSAPPPSSANEEPILGESKPGAAAIIPKEEKRQISADARADFQKASERYAAAKKSGTPLPLFAAPLVPAPLGSSPR